MHVEANAEAIRLVADSQTALCCSKLNVRRFYENAKLDGLKADEVNRFIPWEPDPFASPFRLALRELK
jgi:hypothetical protein